MTFFLYFLLFLCTLENLYFLCFCFNKHAGVYVILGSCNYTLAVISLSVSANRQNIGCAYDIADYNTGIHGYMER